MEATIGNNIIIKPIVKTYLDQLYGEPEYDVEDKNPAPESEYEKRVNLLVDELKKLTGVAQLEVLRTHLMCETSKETVDDIMHACEIMCFNMHTLKDLDIKMYPSQYVENYTDKIARVMLGDFSQDELGLTNLKNTLVGLNDSFYTKDEHAEIALRTAIKKKGIDLVEFLISNGVKVNKFDRSGCTHLYYAMCRYNDNKTQENKDIVNLLINKGADLYDTFRSFADRTDIKGLETLLEFGFDVNKEGGKGDAPLHYIASEGLSTDVIQWLIKNGADVNKRNKNRLLPLDCAVEYTRVYDARATENFNVLLKNSNLTVDDITKESSGKTLFSRLLKKYEKEPKTLSDILKQIKNPEEVIIEIVKHNEGIHRWDLLAYMLKDFPGKKNDVLQLLTKPQQTILEETLKRRKKGDLDRDSIMREKTAHAL